MIGYSGEWDQGASTGFAPLGGPRSPWNRSVLRYLTPACSQRRPSRTKGVAPIDSGVLSQSGGATAAALGALLERLS